MAFQQITRIPKAKAYSIPGEEYLRLTIKSLYISSSAGKHLPSDYVQLFIDPKQKLIKLIPCEKGEAEAFKLSRVKGTPDARRIDTNNALRSFVTCGFPQSRLGKRMPISMSIDGALIADYAYHPASVEDRERLAEADPSTASTIV